MRAFFGLRTEGYAKFQVIPHWEVHNPIVAIPHHFAKTACRPRDARLFVRVDDRDARQAVGPWGMSQGPGWLPAFLLIHARYMSHEKNPLTFHYTVCLIGILVMVYYNPHING